MVICGHAWGSTVNNVSKSENIRIDNNNAGYPVYLVLTGYQGNTLNNPGGGGWLRFMEFNKDTATIHFYTYSPTQDKYAGQNGENTFNQPPEFFDFTLPMPVQVLNAPDQHHDRGCHDEHDYSRDMHMPHNREQYQQYGYYK